eukprot:scaffold235556_cov22-Prasinocladus_malaysianus.AAC.1
MRAQVCLFSGYDGLLQCGSSAHRMPSSPSVAIIIREKIARPACSVQGHVFAELALRVNRICRLHYELDYSISLINTFAIIGVLICNARRLLAFRHFKQTT